MIDLQMIMCYLEFYKNRALPQEQDFVFVLPWVLLEAVLPFTLEIRTYVQNNPRVDG